MIKSDTEFARRIDMSEANQLAIDSIAIRLISDKPVLAHIMRSYVPEYAGRPIEKIVACIEGNPKLGKVPVGLDQTNAKNKFDICSASDEQNVTESNDENMLDGNSCPSGQSLIGDNTVDKTNTEGTVMYDILFHAVLPDSDEEIDIIINLEIQNRDSLKNPFLPRAVYYASRLISAQKGRFFKKTEYVKLKKVYSIWICPSPAKEKRMTVNRYSLTEECLVGKFHEPMKNFDLLSIIRIGVGDPSFRTETDALKLLSILFSKKEGKRIRKEVESIFNIKMKEEEVEKMTMVQGFYEQGLEEGLEQGLERGLERGRQDGRREGEEIGTLKTSLENIRNLMRTMHLSLENAMDALCVKPEMRTQLAAMI